MAQTLFHGGTIHTLEESVPQVEAVLIDNERIVAIGDFDDLKQRSGSECLMHDLNGRTLLPGFVEAHSHILWAAKTRGAPVVDIRALVEPSFAQVMDKVERRIRHADKNEWLVFFGLDAQLHQDMVFPDRTTLDAIAPDNPIAIQTSNCHAVYLNSAALKVCELTASTPDKPGGVIERDDSGNPTGKVMEATTWEVLDRFYAAWGEQRLTDQFHVSADTFLSQGITTVTEHLYLPYYKGYYRRALADGRPLPRIAAYQQATTADMLVDDLTSDGDRLWMAGVKIHADGSPFIGNIWLSQPYLETPVTLERMNLQPGHTGHLNYDIDYFRDMVRRYFDAGWQMSIHTQGDRTIDMVLDTVEQLLADRPRSDHRFRLEHCALMRDDQLERAMQLGVLCSFFVSHIRYWGSPIADMLFGAERAEHYMPVGSAVRRGMRASLHADTPMADASSLQLMHTAVTRQTDLGRVIGDSERISPMEALKAVTIDAAYQLFMEDKLGSISQGKYADLVVLDDDPLAGSPHSLDRNAVHQTFLNGQSVYRRDPG